VVFQAFGPSQHRTQPFGRFVVFPQQAQGHADMVVSI
jgi:hypothetical protein